MLEELLGAELAAQVQEKLGDKKLGVVNDGTWLPKSKFDEVNEEVKSYKAQLAERDDQLTKLAKENKGSEDLIAQINQLKEQNQLATEQFQKELQDRDFNYALEKSLSSSKVRNTKAAKALLDLEKVALKDGQLEGIEEQLNALKETDSYLFLSEETVVKPPHITGGSTTPPPAEDVFSSVFADYKK